MLALIGIGLDSGDISLKSLDFIRASERVLVDRYTSVISNDSISLIERETGKKTEQVSRSDLEENAKETIKAATSSNVSILVIGDPLVATTHHILLDEATRQGIETRVFHSSSIFSAGIGESGLDIYKFGPTTTIPFWSEHYRPTSFIDVVSKNVSNGEHTLMLFDIDQKMFRPMAIREATDIISKADKAHAIKPGTKVLLLADIGRESQSIHYTEFSKLAKLAEKAEGKLLALIVPAELNFAEEDALKKFIA